MREVHGDENRYSAGIDYAITFFYRSKKDKTCLIVIHNSLFGSFCKSAYHNSWVRLKTYNFKTETKDKVEN